MGHLAKINVKIKSIKRSINIIYATESLHYTEVILFADFCHVKTFIDRKKLARILKHIYLAELKRIAFLLHSYVVWVSQD